jgi:hypothetical protein
VHVPPKDPTGNQSTYFQDMETFSTKKIKGLKSVLISSKLFLLVALDGLIFDKNFPNRIRLQHNQAEQDF